MLAYDTCTTLCVVVHTDKGSGALSRAAQHRPSSSCKPLCLGRSTDLACNKQAVNPMQECKQKNTCAHHLAGSPGLGAAGSHGHQGRHACNLNCFHTDAASGGHPRFRGSCGQITSNCRILHACLVASPAHVQFRPRAALRVCIIAFCIPPCSLQ